MAETLEQSLKRLMKYTNIATSGVPNPKTNTLDWQTVIEFNDGVDAYEFSQLMAQFARNGESH